MYSDGVDVFHIAYGDHGVVCVAHDLVFDLLVSADALFDKHLMHGGELQRVLHYFAQLVLIVGKAASGAAERECGAQNDGISDVARRALGFLDRVGYDGGEHRLAEALAKLLEFFAVLRHIYRFGACAKQLRLALGKYSLPLKLHCEIQTRLSADSGKDCVRALISDDLRHIFERQRLHVDLIRHRRVGHYSSGVGVHEYYLVSLFAQRNARLRSGVVEFRRLSDNDRSRAYNKYFLYIASLRHRRSPSSYL